MAQDAQLRIDTSLPVYSCDPHSSWQCGTIQNIDGLLWQRFPKGTDLSAYSTYDLAAVVAALNGRPRKDPDLRMPTKALDQALRAAQAGVAMPG